MHLNNTYNYKVTCTSGEHDPSSTILLALSSTVWPKPELLHKSPSIEMLEPVFNLNNVKQARHKNCKHFSTTDGHATTCKFSFDDPSFTSRNAILFCFLTLLIHPATRVEGLSGEECSRIPRIVRLSTNLTTVSASMGFYWNQVAELDLKMTCN